MHFHISKSIYLYFQKTLILKNNINISSCFPLPTPSQQSSILQQLCFSNSLSVSISPVSNFPLLSSVFPCLAQNSWKKIGPRISEENAVIQHWSPSLGACLKIQILGTIPNLVIQISRGRVPKCVFATSSSRNSDRTGLMTGVWEPLS